MTPIDPIEIPVEILDLIGEVKNVCFPRQGDTSDLAIVEVAQGQFVLKRTRGPQFRSWLRREVQVLELLSDADIPVPKSHLFVEREELDQSWAVMEFLKGETLRQALHDVHKSDRHLEAVYNFGRVLSKIHSIPCPKQLQGEIAWIDNMLSQAKFNLENYSVDGNQELLDCLTTNKPAPITQTFIHGDFTIDNVLVDDGKITGVVDWSGGAFGDPRYDLCLAIQPKPDVFADPLDVNTFFEGYGNRTVTDMDFAYFTGLYEFF